MNENGPILFRTLGPVLGSKSLPTVMYDDEPAEGKTGGLEGHTKGVEVTDCMAIVLLNDVATPGVSLFRCPGNRIAPARAVSGAEFLNQGLTA
ncbi:hypothetical protein pipiens_014454 [Culex pipiens pipiens]|uniref:Uncharacterized protein n=1 Tax=Culex pipiens pipiens TaxID=38569 RepID=A0ABD1CUJ5_CULPP